MNIEVFLTGHTVTDEDVQGRTVVVIDVLRASSTIAAALHNGARAVIPVADMAEAGKIASNLDPSSYLLGGERHGDKIEGYHLGNSPIEYTAEVVKDRTVILTTTNGTRALAKARAAEHLLVGSFLNASAVISFIEAAGRDVAIICAGKQDRVSLEDTLCAGMLLQRLWGEDAPALLPDAARLAYTQYKHDRERLGEALRNAAHARYLAEKGYGSDVDFVLRTDALPVLPLYKENQLVLHRSNSKKVLA